MCVRVGANTREFKSSREFVETARDARAKCTDFFPKCPRQQPAQPYNERRTPTIRNTRARSREERKHAKKGRDPIGCTCKTSAQQQRAYVTVPGKKLVRCKRVRSKSKELNPLSFHELEESKSHRRACMDPRCTRE
jgi:hypothetical protein